MSQKIRIYPVDKVYISESRVVDSEILDDYSCTLNQTDIVKNKNKYYIMQIIKNKDKYVLFIRYGRIGEDSAWKKPIVKTYDNQKKVIDAFVKQFKAKTGNIWKNSFVKKDGKYFLTDVEYEVDAKDIIKIDKKIESKLDDRVKFLIELFTDKKTMENALISLSIDSKKMPLGKISKKQLDCAQDLLNKLKTVINNISEDDEYKDECVKLSSEFYTYVPYCSGRKKPPIINNDDTLGKFIEMVDELKNMEVAIKITNKESSDIDNVYNSLNAKIHPVEKFSDEWNFIFDYVHNTHGSTHSFKVELINVYKLDRNEKEITKSTMEKIGNKHLLWHGSRMTNFCSIVKNGLLLNPETLGVKITGKMFSQGIYMASSFSKSFNYCDSTISNDYACLLLCESALGKQLKRTQADPKLSPTKLKIEGCDSTCGVGKNTPSSAIKIDDTTVPNGTLHNSGVSSCLLYDEYIVYNVDQIVLKYLVLIKKN